MDFGLVRSLSSGKTTSGTSFLSAHSSTLKMNSEFSLDLVFKLVNYQVHDVFLPAVVLGLNYRRDCPALRSSLTLELIRYLNMCIVQS